METQQKKRELAELLLSPGQHAESEHGLDRLRVGKRNIKQCRKRTNYTVVLPVVVEMMGSDEQGNRRWAIHQFGTLP